MRGKLLAGNWKMNKSLGELDGFFQALASELHLPSPALTERVGILFAVPFTMLERAQRLAAPLGIGIAAQNIHWEQQGAYTGEISLNMIKELGVKTTLVGHSERRQYFGETNATVAKKVAACLACGVAPILCIGETRAEREAGQTENIIKQQLEAVFAAINAPGPLIIAYEPVWAIGTGLSATSQQAEDVHRYIRTLIAQRFGADLGARILILYGGSANPKNAAELLRQPDIDGALVGGASLQVGDFASMIKVAAAQAL